jgi:3-oxoacyl-[acyl-carrier protein] reductase
MTARCLVFGGTGAVGSAVCAELVESDAKVAFTYFSNLQKAKDVESSLQGTKSFKCDFKNEKSLEESIDGALEFLGGLDAAIFCIGSPPGEIFTKDRGVSKNFETFSDSSNSKLQQIFDISVTGVFRASRKILPALEKSENGNIIFIGSLDGVKTLPSPVQFASARGAVKSFAEALSKEVGPLKIKCNQIAMGLLDSGSSMGLSIDLRKNYLKHCALQRYGKPEEIAAVAGWLALHNTYMTGQSIILDGGL